MSLNSRSRSSALRLSQVGVPLVQLGARVVDSERYAASRIRRGRNRYASSPAKSAESGRITSRRTREGIRLCRGSDRTSRRRAADRTDVEHHPLHRSRGDHGPLVGRQPFEASGEGSAWIVEGTGSRRDRPTTQPSLSRVSTSSSTSIATSSSGEEGICPGRPRRSATPRPRQRRAVEQEFGPARRLSAPVSGSSRIEVA